MMQMRFFLLSVATALVYGCNATPDVALHNEDQIVPPKFDPSDPTTLVKGCGVQLPAGVTIDTGVLASANLPQPCSCGETYPDYLSGGMVCRIEINPANCAGQDICQTLQHEMQHCAQLREIEKACQAQLGANAAAGRVSQCIECSKNSYILLMEAQAHCGELTFQPPAGSAQWTELPGAKACPGAQTPAQACFQLCWDIADANSSPNAQSCGGLPAGRDPQADEFLVTRRATARSLPAARPKP